MKAFRLLAGFRGEVELVLAEVLNNVVEHALPGHMNNEISVCGQIGAGCLSLQVSDHGAPLPGGQIPDGLLPGLDVSFQDLPEGGFGWMLVRQLTSDLHYSRQAGMNRLCMCFSLERAAWHPHSSAGKC
jgi:serine/threonine-protein kinase RsbW